MFILSAALLSALAPSSFTSIVEDKITQTDVQNAIELVDRATRLRDLPLLANTISENARFDIHQVTPCGTHRMAMSKQEFLLGVELAWNLARSHNYQRMYTHAEVADNAESATSSSFIIESFTNQFTNQGRKVTMYTKETVTFSLLQGTAVAEHIKSEVTVDSCIQGSSPYHR